MLNRCILNEAKAIKKYFKKCNSTIESILDKPETRVSKEDFHKLRVEIKKIKAVCKLVKFCNKDFKRKKFLKPYRSVFKQAGKVRELQLETNMLSKQKTLHSSDNYAKNLQNKIAEEKHRFVLLTEKKKISKLSKNNKKFIAFLDDISEHKLNLFFEEQHKQADALMSQKNLTAESAHQLRKRLKELLYITKIFKPKSHQSKNINDLQDLLGEWHDKVVLKGYLQNTIRSGSLNPKEIKSIQTVEHKTVEENKRLFNKIKQNISQFQHQHTLQ